MDWRFQEGPTDVESKFLTTKLYFIFVSHNFTLLVSRGVQIGRLVWMVAWDPGVIDPSVFSARRPLGKVYRKLWARRKPEPWPVVLPL